MSAVSIQFLSERLSTYRGRAFFFYGEACWEEENLALKIDGLMLGARDRVRGSHQREWLCLIILYGVEKGTVVDGALGGNLVL